MNDLRPRFERETGQVMLEGLPFGAAGEAVLAPVAGLDLAFDRADGRLCRAIVQTAGGRGSTALGEQVAAMLIRLFGSEACEVVLGAATPPGEAPPGARVLSPDPALADALSSLARIHAVWRTSPMRLGSSWWSTESAEFAERAGLPELAIAEAGPWGAVPPAPTPALSVAAEAERLEKDRDFPGRPEWILDSGVVPDGLFQFGLSPCSDLVVRVPGRRGRIVAQAQLAPGADCGAVAACLVRLVDPGARRILAQAPFTVAGSWARAELRPPFPPAELPESWIEVVPDKRRAVGSAKGHRIRRALRWADAALRAERAPAALDPVATEENWSALADAAWSRCSLDWEAVGDADRAYLAARRQVTFDHCLPAPSATAAEIARQAQLAGPGYLAEAVGG